MFGLIARLVGFLVRLALGLIFYATPVIGFWVASSLAAYLGGPHWMAWLAGALLFPIIPGIWELHAYANRDPIRKAWFTPVDRVSMRTFAVGVVFLAALLALYPQTAFVALSTRGDWMLDQVKDPRAATARRILFASAGGLEWLYRATKTNPFKSHIDHKALQRTEEAKREIDKYLAEQRAQQAGQQQTQETAQKPEQGTEQQHEQETAQKPEKQTDQQHEQETAQKPEQQPAHQQEKPISPKAKLAKIWPWKQATLHPAIAAMPASVETSIESVANYIADKEHDPVLRIKALHDYVADRIAYDSDAFYSGDYGDQDAQTVFKNRKGVCAGYANLLSALAAAISEDIVVVAGDARNSETGNQLTGTGHAWNAARIDGRWYLIDSCWDAGTVSRDKGFTKAYKTDYLLPPPEVMIEDHFPEDDTWQLLAQPLSQGDFLRQPMLRPSFQAADLTLVAPQRALNEMGSNAVVVVKNPKSKWLIAGLAQNGKPIGYSTQPTNSKTAQMACALPDKGTYKLNMFLNDSGREGDYKFIGSLDFVNR